MRKLGLFLAVIVVVTGAWLLLVTFLPLGADTLVSAAQPTTNRDEALARWAVVQDRDDETIDPRCRSWSLLHDEPVETTVVLFHGYTNCPYQWRRLGEELYARGWNVIAPRLPRHGYADKLTSEQGEFTAEDLIAAADEAIDVAVGLSDEVVVGGISGGGSVAVWVAQNRPDVDRVVALAPEVNLGVIPSWFARQVANTFLVLPDIQVWWDLNKRESIPPDYGYPKFSTHAVAQLIRLGQATLEQAKASAPGVDDVLLTTNRNDQAVNIATVEDLVAAWREGGADATIYEWPEAMGLAHNMVDDVVNAEHFEEVYPILIELFTSGEGAAAEGEPGDALALSDR